MMEERKYERKEEDMRKQRMEERNEGDEGEKTGRKLEG
jgi:hypothetical protein